MAYWSAERLPLEQESPLGYPDVAPDLCVEVLSRSERRRSVRAKIREYFDTGVRMVWVVEPDDRSVTVYRSPGDARVVDEAAVLSGEDVIPGFSVPVAELFAP